MLLSVSGAQIFVASGQTIGEYSAFGSTVNAAVANPGAVEDLAVAGDDVFYPTGAGSIGVYNYVAGSAGSLSTGGSGGVAVAGWGSDLFVAGSDGTIGEYTTAGQVIDSSLITGLSSDGTTQPLALAVSGPDIFVLTSKADPYLSGAALGTVAEYTTAGALVNSSLVSGVPIKGGNIAAFGGALFIANGSVVSEYTTSGMEENSDLTRGAYFPTAVAVYDSDLFVATSSGVNEYSISGQLMAVNLVAGLTRPTALVVAAPAGKSAQLAFDQQPAGDQVAGITIGSAVTVNVEDSSGVLATSDSSTVTLSIESGPAGASLGGTTTAKVVNGVATFDNLTLPDGGSYILQATDGKLMAGDSVPITALVGSVDVANWGQISGWAFDPTTGSSPINIEVEISGGPAAPQIVAADETRSDLLPVLGSTDHGFDYSPPFLSVGSHSVSVWAIEDNGDGVLIGTGTIVSQNSMFDEGYYLREYPNVAAAVKDGQYATGYDQFVEYGQYEAGYNPSPYWDYWANQWYLEENPDVAAWANAHGVKSAFMQYYEYGQYENRGGLLYFDTSYYVSNNPFAAAAVAAGSVTSPFEHFLLYGQYAGLSPMKYFSSAVCDNENPFILPAVSGEPLTSDFDWFIEYGQSEGAIASNYYNEQVYLTDNPDVAAAVRAGDFPDGLVQWLEYGQYEGRTAL